MDQLKCFDGNAPCQSCLASNQCLALADAVNFSMNMTTFNKLNRKTVVSVVGAGPAGIAAAHLLSKRTDVQILLWDPCPGKYTCGASYEVTVPWEPQPVYGPVYFENLIGYTNAVWLRTSYPGYLGEDGVVWATGYRRYRGPDDDPFRPLWCLEEFESLNSEENTRVVNVCIVGDGPAALQARKVVELSGWAQLSDEETADEVFYVCGYEHPLEANANFYDYDVPQEIVVECRFADTVVQAMAEGQRRAIELIERLNIPEVVR